MLVLSYRLLERKSKLILNSQSNSDNAARIIPKENCMNVTKATLSPRKKNQKTKLIAGLDYHLLRASSCAVHATDPDPGSCRAAVRSCSTSAPSSYKTPAEVHHIASPVAA